MKNTLNCLTSAQANMLLYSLNLFPTKNSEQREDKKYLADQLKTIISNLDREFKNTDHGDAS